MTDDAASGASLASSEREDGASEASPVPFLRIVNADATPEEIAALVAVFAALGSSGESAAPRRTPEWSRPARRLRTPMAHGPGGWRASGLPR